MKLGFLGGASEIGASCILLHIDNKNILMDSGIRQNDNKDALPDFRSIQELGGVDVIIISHAHLDHIGSLPIISKEYPNCRIYMNNMTKDLVRVLLYDSLKIMNQREGEIPYYAETDVENMLNRIFTVNFQMEKEILEGIKLTLYNAGHIAGASCIYLKGNEGSLFYSGDFSLFAQKSVGGAYIPKLRPDVAIYETTYGDKLHANREAEEERLIQLVEECIEKNGKMIIPAFALGRAQEIILILKRAMNTKRIKKVKIFVDGMVRDINRMYKRNPLYLKNNLGKKILKGIEPFYDANIKAIKKREERDEILKSSEPVIIISSSGMLSGGPSQSYAEKIAGMENGYIVITGYQDEEAPGRKLLELLNAKEEDRYLTINNKKIPVKCTVDKVGLSAHGDKSEIKALNENLNPKNIFLVHGDRAIIESFASELNKEVMKRIYTPKSGETFEIQVRTPRKQYIKEFKKTMKESEAPIDSGMKKLREFVQLYYPGKGFTVEELHFIWHGKEGTEEMIPEFQQLLVDGVYFQNDRKRLFIFKAKTDEELKADLQPKELNQTDVNEIAGKLFSEYDFRKISLNIQDKKATINFDFPMASRDGFEDRMEEFSEKTNWGIEKNHNINVNAANILIRESVNEGNILKISYMIDKGYFQVKYEGADIPKETFENFKEKTGCDMKINSSGNVDTITINNNELLFESNAKDAMEQNQVIALIDQVFQNEKVKPTKKSIKNAVGGKFIELSFISPVVGMRFENTLRDIANMSGWRIAIKDAFNQNEMLIIARVICTENNISINKNPSFNPVTKVVSVKVDDAIDGLEMDEMKEEFYNRTGCGLDQIL